MQPIVFGRYTLIEQLGSGGMAEVFLAKTSESRGLERLVAIKRIHGSLVADPKFTSMFIDEANLAAKLAHANIAQIFDLGKFHGQYFIAMEYVHGRDLRALFRHHQSLRQTIPLPQACYIGLKMCEGLDYAHNRRDWSGRELGLVHRDVSLNNLILSFDGELKIIDFGVAKAVGRSVRTETGFVKGKIAYMSPEQLSRQPLDRRSDVFACGIVLFEILSGKRVFSVPSLRDLIQKVRNADVPRLREINPDVPAELEAIVRKALQKKPDKRYQSAGQLHDALLDYVQSEKHYITRNQVAEWMQKLYAEQYIAESARIAALWEVSKKIERQSETPGGEPNEGYVARPDAQTRVKSRSGGVPLNVGTMPGWAPPDSGPHTEPNFHPKADDSLATCMFHSASDDGSPAQDESEPIERRLPLPSPEKSMEQPPGELLAQSFDSSSDLATDVLADEPTEERPEYSVEVIVDKESAGPGEGPSEALAPQRRAPALARSVQATWIAAAVVLCLVLGILIAVTL